MTETHIGLLRDSWLFTPSAKSRGELGLQFGERLAQKFGGSANAWHAAGVAVHAQPKCALWAGRRGAEQTQAGDPITEQARQTREAHPGRGERGHRFTAVATNRDLRFVRQPGQPRELRDLGQ